MVVFVQLWPFSVLIVVLCSWLFFSGVRRSFEKIERQRQEEKAREQALLDEVRSERDAEFKLIEQRRSQAVGEMRELVRELSRQLDATTMLLSVDKRIAEIREKQERVRVLAKRARDAFPTTATREKSDAEYRYSSAKHEFLKEALAAIKAQNPKYDSKELTDISLERLRSERFGSLDVENIHPEDVNNYYRIIMQGNIAAGELANQIGALNGPKSRAEKNLYQRRIVIEETAQEPKA